MATKTLEELLDELLSNRIGPEDARLFAVWIDEPGGREELERLLDAIFGDGDMEVKPDAARQQLVKAMLMEKIGAAGGDLPAGGYAGLAGGDAIAGVGGAVAGVDEADADIVVRIRRRGIRWMGRAAAVAMLILLAGGWWLFLRRPVTAVASREERYHNDIAPGVQRAVLQLADGRQIGLDTAAEGVLAMQGGSRLVAREGQLVDEREGGGAAGAMGEAGPGADAGTAGRGAERESSALEYNMVTTPAASQYHLTLSDGTRVWLDALSHIRFPAAFGKGARMVEISGQAYFEVARDVSHPFVVKTGTETVTVLGTAFNICAYGDEPVMRTTLAQGAVKVNAGGTGLLLKPREEALLDKNGTLRRRGDADLATTLAWKNGLFAYEGADITTIMRQLARWYDITVDYRSRITESFVAEIPRDVPLSKALSLLEATGQVHFIIRGKQVTVTR